MIVNWSGKKQGSSLKGDIAMSFRTQGDSCLSIHSSIHQSIRLSPPGLLRPEICPIRPEIHPFRPERADSRLEKADFRPKRVDFRPGRADIRPIKADFRPKRTRGDG